MSGTGGGGGFSYSCKFRQRIMLKISILFWQLPNMCKQIFKKIVFILFFNNKNKLPSNC